MDGTVDFGIDMDLVRSHLRLQEAERNKKLCTSWVEARRDCEQIINRIILQCSPRRIYQWGSLLDVSKFSEISDIDIAVEGLSGPEEYFAIVGFSSEMTSFPVDVIELDKIDKETAQHIRTYGRLVYERKDS